MQLPNCPTCGTAMGRFAWWEHKDEPIWYWLCYDCDLKDIEPCIHALFRRATKEK